MVALGLSAPAASALLAEAVTLVGRLPATLAALEDGAIGPGHARLLAELLGPLPDDAARAAAIRDRSVRMLPGEDGMAALSATLPTPVAAACRPPGDARTVEQAMVDCLVDLILRPGEDRAAAGDRPADRGRPVATLRGGTSPGRSTGNRCPR